MLLRQEVREPALYSSVLQAVATGAGEPAKIASAVEAGLVGFELYRAGSQFYGGDGIIEHGVENTIRNVGDLASRGMRATDEEIIRMMIKNME